MRASGMRVVLAGIRVRDCLALPGAADGSWFRDNPPQHLRLGERMDRAILGVLYGGPGTGPAFFRDGIRVICNCMEINRNGGILFRRLSAVCGRSAAAALRRRRLSAEARVMLRLYEIPSKRSLLLPCATCE